MKSEFFVGCSGFNHGFWKGFFYPENLPPKEHLAFYATHLRCVEINSTFYRRPMLKTLQNWYDCTDSGFKFFIKIPKNITHIKRLRDSSEDTTVFCQHIFSGLQNKLAGFLFQLPPSYKFSAENLDFLLISVDRNFRNVVEFRDASWWNEEVFDILAANEIIFSGVNFPKNIPKDVVINSDEMLYYRLHGVPTLFKSEYSAEDLQSLAKKIRQFHGKAFVFFNNTWGTAGISNALALRKIVENL